jgi:flagellar hook assembly protein FlgD
MNSKVNIVVYDITGKVISTLVNETKSAGFHTVEFNASNLSSGVYFYMMTTESFKDIKKLTVIK